MNNPNMNSRNGKLAIALGIVVIVYSVILFAVCGFEDHTSPFWLSYAFMLLGIAVGVCTSLKLSTYTIQPRDWLFGYPIMRHTVIYLVIEFVASTVFIALECSGNTDFPEWLPFVAQLVILAIHVVLIISCFFVQETIMDVQNKVKDSTSFIKLLTVDIEMVIEKTCDEGAKKAFKDLADRVRYSDPMSNDNLFELEKQITLCVNEADNYITYGNVEGALACCERANLLLTERNKKVKVLK